MAIGKGKLVIEDESIVWYDSLEKTTVKATNSKGGYSSKVSLPKSWAGKKILCLLLEEPDEPYIEK